MMRMRSGAGLQRKRPVEAINVVLVDIDKDTADLLRMLREAGETHNDVMMKLILHYVMTDPNMPQVALTDKGRQILYGGFNGEYL